MGTSTLADRVVELEQQIKEFKASQIINGDNSRYFENTLTLTGTVTQDGDGYKNVRYSGSPNPYYDAFEVACAFSSEQHFTRATLFYECYVGGVKVDLGDQPVSRYYQFGSVDDYMMMFPLGNSGLGIRVRRLPMNPTGWVNFEAGETYWDVTVMTNTPYVPSIAVGTEVRVVLKVKSNNRGVFYVKYSV